MSLTKPNIILASKSPRRQELLTRMGVAFVAVPSAFEETLDNTRSPEEVAIELALGKAMDVAEQAPDSIIIGSDTIVTVSGEHLGKPKDKKEAKKMLKKLSGKYNTVTTGVAIYRKLDGLKLVGSDTSQVYLKKY